MNSHKLLSFPTTASSEEKPAIRIATRTIEARENVPSSKDVQEIDYIMHLHKLGRLLCTLTEKHIEFLCQEVKAITQGRIRLHLGTQVVPSSDVFSILLLQFNSIKYGYLALMRDATHLDQPAIPLLTAHIIAQDISCILHMLDQHLFLQSFGKTSEGWPTINLTRREQNVLSLMCQGYTEEEIAALLTVSRATVNTHRQHIYEQLGVHNEYTARIAAFNLGLFSFLIPERSNP
ncbi:MAG TPA: helix-turn-helix transcriptional regulator [Ktedonosporobacter sp.]|jgi:DNA-binding CsgD family transcriptional regulator|nr:helix-turn-helix transcriptional regulator [Ktedonosporobacter sp.]